MPTFAYRAATPHGRTLHGREDAASAAALERTLSDRGLYLIEAAPSGDAARRPRQLFRGRRADVVRAMRYLSTLTGAQFPLDRALGTTARVAARDDVAEALLAVRAHVRGGARLADAMAEHPHIFPRLAVGMVRAGERGGHLAQALSRVADQLDREQALRARLTSAALYPAVMLIAGGAAVAVLLVYVLPRLVEMLQESNVPIPRSTAVLLGGAQFVREWWLPLGVGGVVLILLVAAYRRSDEGRLTTDALLLHVPILGALRRQIAAARLGRSLATLLAGGLPALSALDISAEALNDAAARDEVLAAREEVRAGGRLAAALARGRAFPFVFLQMVEVGEEGGRLHEMLERGAEAMEQDLERALERLVRLAEPALILLFGGAVGFFAMAMLQAIYGVRIDGL